MTYTNENIYSVNGKGGQFRTKKEIEMEEENVLGHICEDVEKCVHVERICGEEILVNIKLQAPRL